MSHYKINGNSKIENILVNTCQVRSSVIGYLPQINSDVIIQTAKPIEESFELTFQLKELAVVM
ncbi:MAG: hypothetical protein ROY99_04335 [Ignavibacterium sp.]|nr:hypothetical protein [Ignavibacterium sp.]